MSIPEPDKITTPWASTGSKNPIPQVANNTTGAAGFDKGFPDITMTPEEAGGLPPAGQDFNGILYSITEMLRYIQAGGVPTFSASLASAIGGYPKGSLVIGGDGATIFQSKITSNMDNPNVSPSNWSLVDIGLKKLISGGGSLASPYGVINVDLPPYSGDFGAAIDAAPIGAKLFIGLRDYNIVGKFSLSNLLTKQLEICGSGMPMYSEDGTRFITGSGSVIQGSFVTGVSGIRAHDFGVDCGSYVVDNLAGGEWLEGLVISNEIHNDPFNFNKYSRDCHVGNIRVLMKDSTGIPATAKHGILLENLYGGSHGYLETRGGYHGFAYKSYGVQPKGPVVAYGQQGEAAIFKSDANSICGRYKGGNLILGKSGFTTQVALITQAGIGSAWVDISAHVSLINIANRGFLNVLDSPSATCSDFHVLSIDSDGCAGVTVEVPENAIRWKIGPHSISNTTYGIGVVDGAYQTQIEDGAINNASQYKYVFNADVTHGHLLCGGSGVADVLTSVPIDKNIIKSTTGSTSIVNTYDSNSKVVLQNSWSGASLNSEMSNNTFTLGGFVTGGTSDLVAIMSSGEFRPKKRIDLPVVIENSDLTRGVTAAYITPAGEIFVYNGAAIGTSGGKVFLDGLSWIVV